MINADSKPPESLKILLSLSEAAASLAISERKLWGMTANHEIPHIRLGRCLRFSVKDLERWIDEHKEGGEQR